MSITTLSASTTGTYVVTLASGTRHIVNLDTMTTIRVTPVAPSSDAARPEDDDEIGLVEVVECTVGKPLRLVLVRHHPSATKEPRDPHRVTSISEVTICSYTDADAALDGDDDGGGEDLAEAINEIDGDVGWLITIWTVAGETYVFDPLTTFLWRLDRGSANQARGTGPWSVIVDESTIIPRQPGVFRLLQGGQLETAIITSVDRVRRPRSAAPDRYQPDVGGAEG